MQAFGEEQNTSQPVQEPEVILSIVAQTEETVPSLNCDQATENELVIDTVILQTEETEQKAPEQEVKPISMQAPDEEPNTPAPEMMATSTCCWFDDVQPLLEFKFGYFIFADSKMRDIYDRGGLDLQLSVSYPVWRWLDIYGSVEYFRLHGKSLGGNQETSIWEIPLSLGLKPIITITNTVQYYIAIGPRYFFVHQHNKSEFVDKNLSQNGIGGFVNTGFNFFPLKHLCIDVYGEYSYGRLHFHPDHELVFGRTIQVGGFAFGGGLGYSF